MAILLGQHKFFDFRKRSIEDIKRSVFELLDSKNTDNAESIEDNLQKYLLVVKEIIEKNNDNVFEHILDASAISYLDADLIKEALSDHTEKIRNDVTVQLAMVSASCGITKENFKIYTKKELIEILKGNNTSVNDLVFVYTMNKLSVENTDKETLQTMLQALPKSSEAGILQKQYFWNEAFVFFVFLQVVWRMFEKFEPIGRQFLLQNYFYIAIVAGIPVRIILQDFLKNKNSDDYIALSKDIIKNLEDNQERVPQDITDETGRSLKDLYREFFSEVGYDFISKSQPNGVAELEIGTLSQKLYKEKTDGAFFSAWFREALSILLHLKKGDIEEVSAI